MSGSKQRVVRIVVKGSPFKIVESGSGFEKAVTSNSADARRILLRAFKSDSWPCKAAFAVTPEGFIQAPFPKDYNGLRGWFTPPEDFRRLIPHARKAVERVATTKVMDVARCRADYLTLGVDLNEDGRKLKTAGRSFRTHAELVAVVHTASGEIVRWTGKSYPLVSQEKTLVHETDLKSHLFCCGDERVLVLGCHDLNMFGNRGYVNQNTEGQRRTRCDRMRKLAKKFKPTIILQHPHSTDSPRIWSTGWSRKSGACQFLSSGEDGLEHIYASGIAYYNDSHPKEPRGALCDVLARTRCCDEHVQDVVVTGFMLT